MQEQIDQEIADRNTAITNAINIEVTNRDNAISTAKTEITGDTTETIVSLLRKINTLQDSYDALLARVEDLEAYHNEENV